MMSTCQQMAVRVFWVMFTGSWPQIGAHRLISTNTYAVKVECVPPKNFWLKRVVLFCLCLWRSAMRDRDDGVDRRGRERRLRQWLRHERLSVQMALAKFKRHSSQRAGLARENCVRRTQLHVAETTSRRAAGSPARSSSILLLLARLLAAVLAGGPQGEERGAGEEEEGRAGEAAEKGEDCTAAASSLRRVQHRRFARGIRCAAVWELYATEQAPQSLRSWQGVFRNALLGPATSSKNLQG